MDFVGEGSSNIWDLKDVSKRECRRSLIREVGIVDCIGDLVRQFGWLGLFDLDSNHVIIDKAELCGNIWMNPSN